MTLEKRILNSTYFDAQETRRIYNKYFRTPSRTVRLLLEKYQFDRKRVLEIGSAYGYDLIHFGEGSVGLDVREVFREFGASVGLDIRLANVEQELPIFEQPFEAVYAGNIVEHVVAPHLLLMRFHRVLVDGGLLGIKVPLTPPRWIGSLYKQAGLHHDYDNMQHISFFTPITIKWTVERAGYEVIGLHSPLLSSKRWLEWTSPLVLPYTPSVMVIGRKIPNFQYHEERIAEYNPPYAEDLLPYYRR
jgi:SAM-dependent methyltransferase